MRTDSKIRKGTDLAAATQTEIRFWISEIYASVQGEGLLTGTPSLFVRTSGCNLRCWFCDTRFTSWEPTGNYLTLDDIREHSQPLGLSHVVLTGGEPMIHTRISELCRALRQPDHHLTIETAGTVYRSLECDLMSISPKLASSAPNAADGSASRSWQATHHGRRERLDVVRRLMHEHDYQLKFVVDCEDDADEVLQYLERLGSFRCDRVLLMPQGTDRLALARQADWLIPWCQQHDLRFCPRSHIEWFGNRRGT